MDPLALAGAVGAVVAAVIGATWSLRGALSGIERALSAHVAESKQRFHDLGDRVARLERSGHPLRGRVSGDRD